MARILVVEDDLPTLEALKLLLRKEFGEEVVIDPARNVPDAQKLIQKACEDRRPYDAGVLDVMLPPRPGQSAEMDARLCVEIREKMKDTLVLHITAFAEESPVKAHLADFHSGDKDPSACVFPKSAGWETRVLEKLKSYIHGNRIQAQLNNLFGAAERGGSERVRAGYPLPGMRGGLTHRLARLSRDIEAHWTELDCDLQQDIRKNFYVDPEAGGGVLVTLKMPGSE